MRVLDLIWEDAHGLAVNKPAGLLTHPARSSSDEITLEALVRHHLRPDDPGSVYLGTVHRLDRPVSGVVLWAKTPKAAHRWAEQFAHRRTHKEYWAILQSGPTAAPDRWDDWLTSPDRSGQARVASAEAAGSVHALTRVAVGDPAQLIATGSFAWFKLFPETGRTHQLRAQAASRGMPVVGDLTYGATSMFESGIALHARTLTVEHPARHELMTISADLPPAWLGWLRTG